MKWKMTFIFLTGFWVHETLVHLWLAVDGHLPLASQMFFGITITPELNTIAIALNSLLVILFGYFGFVHNWEHETHVRREA